LLALAVLLGADQLLAVDDEHRTARRRFSRARRGDRSRPRKTSVTVTVRRV